MPVSVTGNIKFNLEADEAYMITCKQLGISKPGSGSIEEDIEDLREQVLKKVSEEFKVPPEAVSVTGYSMNLAFSIEGPTNHTLNEFIMDHPTKED